MNNLGSIFVLAWPETKVYNAGAWYDGLMRFVGFSNKGYYKAGHAALTLVNHQTGELHYFDFGRYHTPIGTGRVRDKETDPDVNIPFHAELDAHGQITNKNEIVRFLAKNKANHGDGKLIASLYQNIDFDKAFRKAKAMQDKGAIAYGPFVIGGTNCSRFVATIIQAGTQNWLKKFLFNFPYVLTPSPLSNVKMANSFSHYFSVHPKEVRLKRSLISFAYNLK